MTTTTSTTTTSTTTSTTTTSTTTTTTMPPTTTTTKGPVKKKTSVPLFFADTTLDDPDFIFGKNNFSGLGELPVPIPEELDEDFSDFQESRVRNYEFWFAGDAMFLSYNGTKIFHIEQTGNVTFKNATGDTLATLTPDGDLTVGKDITAQQVNVQSLIAALLVQSLNGDFTNLTAVSKLFDIPHPSHPGTEKRLHLGCLEGPELAVYIRGVLHPHDRYSYIMFPDYWKDLVDLSTVVVQLTPSRSFSVGNDRIFVDTDTPTLDPVHYFITAERKDVPKLVVEPPLPPSP